MDSTQLLLNEQLVTITADHQTIQRLNDDDQYLADYINRAAKSGQFHFLFTKDPSLRRIVVKRVPINSIQVWNKKGRPSDNDTAATILLLKLRNSSKYAPKFKENYTLKNNVWDAIANEMRIAGFDVDGQKCAQKFIQLTQIYQKKDCHCLDNSEMSLELKKAFGEKEKRVDNNSDNDDEEWLPKPKRMRKTEDDEDFFKKILKKNSDLKEERYKEVCSLIKRRNDLLETKIKQNSELLSIMRKLIK